MQSDQTISHADSDHDFARQIMISSQCPQNIITPTKKKKKRKEEEEEEEEEEKDNIDTFKTAE
jgi:hypothetical protein